MIYEVEINGRTRRVEVERDEGRYLVTVDGHRHVADVTVINGAFSLILGSPEGGPHDGLDVGAGVSRPGTRKSYEVAIDEQAPASGNLTVYVNGRAINAAVGTSPGSWARRAHDAGAAGHGPQPVTAPMPGKVVKVLVKVGDQVAARQGVIVVEAMKMENELRAPKAGTVIEVKVTEGTSVEAGMVLAVIE